MLDLRMNLLQKRNEGMVEKIIHQEDDKHANKYLRFDVYNEIYALEVLKIKEIINNTEVTEVPNTSPFVRGVISLRGTIIPIINCRRCLDSHEINEGRKKNIIILGYNGLVAGLPVSRVRDVIYVNEDKFSAVPQFAGKEKMEFFKGIIEYGDRFIMVIKTEALLGNLKNKISKTAF